jgi:hypothetical protein
MYRQRHDRILLDRVGALRTCDNLVVYDRRHRFLFCE